ncbi:MAG: hypothetical protein BWK80_45715 [Desulfobacteraceae bacterium IS3]|nr:MAG: hypothetical protein BWK80_45715 [Desulfobacteraceae bacterium IS3]
MVISNIVISENISGIRHSVYISGEPSCTFQDFFHVILNKAGFTSPRMICNSYPICPFKARYNKNTGSIFVQIAELYPIIKQNRIFYKASVLT